MEQRNKNEIGEKEMLEYPKVLDMALDFNDHRTPLSKLRENVYDFVAEWEGADGGCDIGFRKEAIILDIPLGQIVCFERGTVHGRFHEEDPRKSVGALIDILKWICGQFDWVFEGQKLVVETDATFEVMARNPKHVLDSMTDKNKIASSFGLMAPYGIGYKLFLMPLDQRDRELRIRIEPWASDPERKYFVHIENFREGVAAPNVWDCLEEILVLVKDIRKKAGSSK